MSADLKKLITNLVKEVLIFEKLRGSFNLGEFKQLSKTVDSKELLKYATERLGPPIGEGSSRTVFILSSNKVLKLAYDQNWTKEGAGRAQNEAEVEVATNPKVQKVIARVLDFDPNFKWIISELTKPISYREIKKILGVSEELFVRVLDKSLRSEIPVEKAIQNLANEYKSEYNYAESREREYDMIYYSGLIKELDKINIDLIKPVIVGIVAMKKEFGFNIDDLVRFDHYGKTADGRLVVIDYGFTREIGNKFYR